VKRERRSRQGAGGSSPTVKRGIITRETEVSANSETGIGRKGGLFAQRFLLRREASLRRVSSYVHPDIYHPGIHHRYTPVTHPGIHYPVHLPREATYLPTHPGRHIYTRRLPRAS